MKKSSKDVRHSSRGVEKREEFTKFIARLRVEFPNLDYSDLARVARWRLHLCDWMNFIRSREFYHLHVSFADALIEYHGISVIDLALKRLCSSRGVMGAGNDKLKEYFYNSDRLLCDCSTRRRDHDEREIARLALLDIFGTNLEMSLMGSDDDARLFVRVWWKCGDGTIVAPLKRALSQSMRAWRNDLEQSTFGALYRTEIL